MMNLDAGEDASEPPELWRLFDVLAIACGGHAGDEVSMARVIAACPDQQLGAHPSYPDPKNFGRLSMPLLPDRIENAVGRQCARLVAVALRLGRQIAWVKPHGALYHDANRDPEIADALLRGAHSVFGALRTDFGVIGPARGALRDAAAERGVRYLREGFADRATRPDGSLVPRGEPGAVITDPAAAAAQAVRLAKDVDTICCHADTPGSLGIARAVREALDG